MTVESQLVSCCATASERTSALDGWLFHYNHRRRHSAIGHQRPISRTNLLGSYR